MVWIHGGGFFFGSASSEIYGPEYLIEHDIVLVTTNYRVGAMGKPVWCLSIGTRITLLHDFPLIQYAFQ